MEKISVIIPVFNEGEKAENAYDSLNLWLSRHNYEYEIFFVDDGSTDNTKTILKQMHKDYKNVSILSYPQNKGKGYAVRQGLLASKHMTKVVLDCDLSVKIDELANIDIHNLKINHIIKGVREQVIKQPIHRILAGKAWKLLVFLKTGLLFDTQCPFWVFRLRRDFYRSLRIDGFAFDVEILYKAKAHGYRTDLIPVKYYNDRDSRVTLKKTINMFFELLSIQK